MSKKSYAELIAEKHKDKDVEIYIGDDTGTINYADHDVAQKSVIRGRIKHAEGDMLTIETPVVTAMQTYIVELDIHAWCIRGVMRAQNNGIGALTIFGNQEIRRLKR